MKGRSCPSSPISFYDKMPSLIEERNAKDVILVDFNKAFDAVSHCVVLHGAWTDVLFAG